jgi:hypothetical protein
MNFDRDKIIDQAQGLAFGVAIAVGLAVGLEVYNAVESTPDAQLLELGFWRNVLAGAVVTAIRSAGTALATALGWTIQGVSGGS